MNISRIMSRKTAAKCLNPVRMFKISVMLALGIACSASPALASSQPSTRLVKCETGNCLLVSGQREGSASAVLINGRAVTVEGNRKWHTVLPVETVRKWSAPWARTIEISYQNANLQNIFAEKADLPIGLMGHNNLAMLVVAAR